MIQKSLVCFCLLVGFSAARPFSPKELSILPGNRPACAEKTLTFCEKVDNYPSELIAKLLKSAKFDISYLYLDESEGLEEPPEYIINVTPSDEDKVRKPRSINASMDEIKLTQMCSVPSKIVKPEIASNRNGEWRFIAQEEWLNIQQKIKVHICSEKPECQQSCMQFYEPVSMQSLAADERLVEDIFWMPSSCRCANDMENML